MRALTLKPHWAHAIAWLGKRCENRSRPIPKTLIGQRIAIHAGASLPRNWSNALYFAAPRSHRSGLSRMPAPSFRCLHGTPGTHDRTTGARHTIRMRAIVATAVLTSWRTPESLPLDAPDWIDWADPEAAYWWRLDNVHTLARPIPWQRGQLGLWRLDDDLVEDYDLGGPLEVA